MTELYSMHLRRASRELCLATPCTTDPSYFSSYCACVTAQKFRLYRRIDPRITQRNGICYLRSKSHMFPEVGHYELSFLVHLLEWKAELPPALCSAERGESLRCRVGQPHCSKVHLHKRLHQLPDSKLKTYLLRSLLVWLWLHWCCQGNRLLNEMLIARQLVPKCLSLPSALAVIILGFTSGFAHSACSWEIFKHVVRRGKRCCQVERQI